MNEQDKNFAAPSIAVVGMAGRFPGARNLTEFWRNLRDGVESISVLDDAHLLAAGATLPRFKIPTTSRRPQSSTTSIASTRHFLV